jgi:DnaK suppressor protein
MSSALKQKSQNSVTQKTGETANSMGFLPYTPQQGEEYMSKEQHAHFTNILELLEKQLVADRDATRKHMQNEGMNLPDILDRAALEEEHKLEWQAREREHRLIKKIGQALAAIQQGDYGYCEDCGTEIGIRRLEARPTATQCIDCKTIHEIREKQTGIVD